MKLEITTPRLVNIKYLYANLGCICHYFDDIEIKFGDKTYESLDDILKDYPQLKGEDYFGDASILLKIDVDSGEVINWPKNCPFDFYNFKLVDTGKYKLLTDEGNTIAEYKGYVPQILGHYGYGDYLMFEIDENSKIIDFKFTQEELDEFMENVRE